MSQYLSNVETWQVLASIPFVIIFIIVCMKILKKPVFGVYAISATLPLLREISFKTSLINISFINLIILVSITSIFLQQCITKSNYQFKIPARIKYGCLILCTGFLLSPFLSGSHSSLRNALTMIGEIAMFYLILKSVRTIKDVKIVLYLLLVSVTINAVLAILGGIFPNAFSQILKIAPPRIIGGSPFPFYRSSGRVMNWGINDCFLLYGIIVVGLSLFHSKILKMNSNLKYLILLILFFAIMIGQTRTSLISLQAAIISAYLLTNINRNKKRIIVAFVITIFITFAFIEYYNELSDIFLSFGTSGMEKRLNSFSLAIRCFLQNPFAGIGYNEFLNKMRVQYYLAGLFTRDIDKMHNLYLFILVGGGLISFIPYLFLIILILKIIVQKIRKTATPEIRYILTVILSTLIGLFIEIAMIPAAGLKLMWMLMGLGVSCGLLSETSRTSFALNITDHKYQLKHNRFQKLKLFGIK